MSSLRKPVPTQFLYALKQQGDMLLYIISSTKELQIKKINIETRRVFKT